ncbi:MAG: hypothetical protein ACQESD_02800 [Thermoplasmatota archaeon]
MTDEGSEGDQQRFWMKGKGSHSSKIFVSFILVIIIMVIIVLSVGAYGYMSWQEWKRGPQIRVTQGLFELREDNDTDLANFTVHITMINEGQEKSEDIEFEWLIMEKSDSKENIYLQKDSMMLGILEKGEEREFTFDISVEPGLYTLAYRAYDGDIFSYEARQSLDVTEGDATGAPETTSVPEFPSVVIPILAVIVIFIFFRRTYNEKGK